jgi:hypothetical protein
LLPLRVQLYAGICETKFLDVYLMSPTTIGKQSERNS